MKPGRMTPRCRNARLRMTGLLLALLVGAPIFASGAEPSREDRIKAALVFKIAKFIEWPAGVIRDDALVVCAAGRSPVVAALAGVDGRAVRGLHARYRHLASTAAEATEGCHLLYLTSEHVGRGIEHLPRGGAAILTVGEGEDFASHGGMIGLVNRGNRVGFEINLRAARAAGIRIAAPLLELAEILE